MAGCQRARREHSPKLSTILGGTAVIRLPIFRSHRATRSAVSAAGSTISSAPTWPHTPTVEWQVCGQCNYDCSYCIQSKKYRVGYPNVTELERAFDFFRGLEGTWEIKMTGGEPFASPLFLNTIVPALAAMPHRISLLTNLSAPVRHLEAFARLAYGRLTIVSASLHLEFTTAASFLDRLARLRRASATETKFVVNSVLVPGRLEALIAVQKEVREAGFRFFPQFMKVGHQVYDYSPADRRIIESMVGDFDEALRQRSANFAPSYQGKLCYTGVRYLVLLQNGEGWSCRSARRHGEGYLGSIHDSTLQLRQMPSPCPYPMCPCTVPANRGMIHGVGTGELGSEDT
jgi:organic radical activating enzyme